MKIIKKNKMQEKILQAVFKDNKPRTVLTTNHFGDILFKESNGQGETYKILQIYINNNNLSQKYQINLKLLILGDTETDYKNFLKKPLLGKRYREEFYVEIMGRYNLYYELQRTIPKKENEVYVANYSHSNLDNFEAFYKSTKEDFYTKVLNECKFDEALLSDLTDIDKIGKLPLFYIQKLYWGYGRTENKEGLYQCINLQNLAVWNEVGTYLNENISKLQNLNLLSAHKIYKLPTPFLDNIYKLPYLVSLCLSENSLTTFPTNIHLAANLKYVDFSHNKFDKFDDLLALNNLKTLNLSHNKLTNLNGISSLKQLETLDVSNNVIYELPEEIKNLSNLKVLNLSENPLLKLPDWICELTQLEELYLEQTQLQSLPENINRLTNLKILKLQKIPFKSLPQTMAKMPKRVIDIELRNKALYDKKAKQKLESFPKGKCMFSSDFNFKLMVIQKLMYDDEVLLPKFDIYTFAKENNIDIEEKGYNILPEAVAYFKALEIPMELLIDIEELLTDGGDEIYAQIIPFWDGEDQTFDVENIKDIKYLPRLKRTNTMNFNKALIKELRSRKIKVRDY